MHGRALHRVLQERKPNALPASIRPARWDAREARLARARKPRRKARREDRRVHRGDLRAEVVDVPRSRRFAHELPRDAPHRPRRRAPRPRICGCACGRGREASARDKAEGEGRARAPRLRAVPRDCARTVEDERTLVVPHREQLERRLPLLRCARRARILSRGLGGARRDRQGGGGGRAVVHERVYGRRILLRGRWILELRVRTLPRDGTRAPCRA